ncbi:unnamed protein product [Blepharisma stoltei]|uniref:WWE domain-containing protein n=1 Tax=Blepharisma stoltei TaxID=1481888 RepID=A0AAU9IH62_9CILI|nr:unnamed protein product [Blepharisma stoltei]
MESGERVYNVYCSEEIARLLQTSGQLQWLESQYQVKVDYQEGRFLLTGRDTPVQAQQQAKHILISLIQQSSIPKSAFQWFWFNGKSYSPYDPDSNQKIEDAFQSQQPALILETFGKLYNINLIHFAQSPLTGKIWRPIIRQPPPMMRRPENRREFTSWTYDDKGKIKPFSREIVMKLEEALKTGTNNVDIRMGSSEFVINLERMEMHNKKTKRIQSVSRETKRPS